MKDTIIRGKYYEINFSNDMIFTPKDCCSIKDILTDILKEQLSVYVQRYNQGFLDITNPETLENIPHILKQIQTDFMKFIDYELSFEKNITYFISMLEKDLTYDDDIINYVWEILYKLEIRLYYQSIEYKGPKILKLIHATPQHLFELPNEVVGIIYEKRPSAQELAILEAKSVAHIIMKDKLGIGSSQKLCMYDLGFLPGLGIVDKPLGKYDRGKFKLGVSIYKKEQIEHAKHINPDYIIVEPEKSYVDSLGIANLAQRQIFYKQLFQAFPNSEIIVTLPKIQFLDIYYNLGNEPKMDITSMMNYSSLYETELKAIFKYPHDYILLTIPDIEEVKDFDAIRTYLQAACLNYYHKKIHVGVELNTSYARTCISEFKRFNHALVNLNTGHDDIQPKNIESPKYALKYSDIHSVVYRKSKKSYLIGKDLNKPAVFQKFICRGFRNFTIKPELFDVMGSIIHRYNKG